MKSIGKIQGCDGCKKMLCAYSKCPKQDEMLKSNLPLYVIFALQQNNNTVVSLKRLNAIGESRVKETIKSFINYKEIILRPITDFVVIEIRK